MSGWVAALLGVVQGVFMFVPVSSTSHLALVQHWLEARGTAMPAPESPEMILFDLVLHVGTVLSIVVVLRKRLLELARRGWEALRPRADGVPRDDEFATLRLLAMLGLSTVVTGVLGLGVRAVAPAVFARPVVIAVLLSATGAILWWTDRANPAGRLRIGAWVAIGIGASQALALLPGLSRSGLTIAAALALGLRRDAAAEYSFLLAIPTILAAASLQSLDVVASGEGLQVGAVPMVIGLLVAAVVGVVALHGVLRLLYAARFRAFSIYVWGLAVVVLATGIGAAPVA